ncbi:MAG: noc [Bacillales bacterium]|jgi:ParB family chromosome partitioning protein|nr:noc [Bacillales bacterium]
MRNSFSKLFNLSDKETVDFQQLTNPSQEEVSDSYLEIPIKSVQPNRFQPRTVFNEDKINELAATLSVHGIIQPIVVREIDSGKYEIIAGERRWRAACKLEWEKIPAIISNLDDNETAAVALIENLQREELSPIEEAKAYEKLLILHNLTQEGLALQLGIAQSTVANKLRLLKLPEKVQQAVLNKNISERHARSLIPLKVEEEQLKIVEEIITKGLNVKQTEERVSKYFNLGNKEDNLKPIKKVINRDVRIALNTLRQSISMISDHGIKVETEENEHDDFYEVTIKIPKNK